MCRSPSFTLRRKSVILGRHGHARALALGLPTRAGGALGRSQVLIRQVPRLLRTGRKPVARNAGSRSGTVSGPGAQLPYSLGNRFTLHEALDQALQRVEWPRKPQLQCGVARIWIPPAQFEHSVGLRRLPER